jgi:hypothetical protein
MAVVGAAEFVRLSPPAEDQAGYVRQRRDEAAGSGEA